MFATKVRMTVALRFFLIAVILFNTLTPTAALAKLSIATSDWGKSLESKVEGNTNEVSVSSLTENHERQNFIRPTSQLREAAQPFESVALQTKFQHCYVLQICVRIRSGGDPD